MTFAARRPAAGTRDAADGYRLDDQVGYLLRRASQRHLAIFAARIPELTPTQFAALARLNQMGPLSQNLLGRETSMDASTIKGVIDRLAARGLVATDPDPEDRRRLVVSLTEAGRALFAGLAAEALAISEETLAPLTAAERRQFLSLLRKLA
ncbi:MAG: MarR family transcriptional regulator [Alphaproteobacteria bacterium]|nr:MAG: MarR family transcriptional regulator [Alphaproteobacteria bacterium]